MPDKIIKDAGHGGMEPGEQIHFRVQTGQFIERANAIELLNQLQREDYPAFMVYQNGYYKVQVGAFVEQDNAVSMERRLRRAGYNTFLCT